MGLVEYLDLVEFELGFFNVVALTPLTKLTVRPLDSSFYSRSLGF